MSFQKKYNLPEDKNTIAFHKSRRMFCIYKNKLHIAEPNLPYSHAVWFEKEGWITEEKDQLMNSITRGIVDNKGDIYFYVGYDFQVTEKTEQEFFHHLEELVEALDLNIDAQIYGSLIKSESGKKWPGIKSYGAISKHIR